MSRLHIGRRLPHQWTRSVQRFNIYHDRPQHLDICKYETACHKSFQLQLKKKWSILALEANVSNYRWWNRSKKNLTSSSRVCLFIQTRFIFLLLFFSLRRTASCCTTNLQFITSASKWDQVQPKTQSDKHWRKLKYFGKKKTKKNISYPVKLSS